MAGPIRISILADGKQATREIGQVDSKLGKLAKGGLRVAGAGFLALGAGAVAAGAGLLGLAKGAAEDDKAQKVLARTLKNTTKATDAQVASVEDYISKTGVATGVTDDEMRPAFATLARSTKDLTKTTNLMNLALDISAGTGKDLGAVTAALAKGAQGSTGALAKLGVQTKDSSGKALSFDKIVQNLSKTFKGQSAAAAGTLEGKWARLKLILGETGETIGGKLLPKLTDFADFVLKKVIPAAGDFGNFLETKVAPKIKTFASDAIPKIKTALDDVKQVWDDNKGKVKEFSDNVATLATNVTTKLVPAVQAALPYLQSLARIDLTNTTNAVKSLNTLLSKGDGTVSGPNGVLAKLQSIGTIASRISPANNLGALASKWINDFGNRFVTDATVRAKIAGWMGRNFVGLASLLPLGQLATVGAVAANAIARAFGVQNPAASVSRFMLTLGRLVLQYNPLTVVHRAGGLLGDAISKGLLNSQPTAAGRARAFARGVGQALISALPGGAVVSAAIGLGVKLITGLGSGISRSIGKALAIVRTIPSRLAHNGGNWGTALYGAGQDLVLGLISGIGSMIGAAADKAASLASAAIQAAKNKLHINSPSKVFIEIGRSVGEGLQAGLSDDTLVKRASRDLASSMVDSFGQPVVPLPKVAQLSTAAISGGTAAVGQPPVIVNVYALADGPEVGRRVVDAIGDYESFNGTGWRK